MPRTHDGRAREAFLVVLDPAPCRTGSGSWAVVWRSLAEEDTQPAGKQMLRAH